MLELDRIYNADCLEIMPQIPDKSIDMVLCDLPYNTTPCKWDCMIPFEPLWNAYKRIIKPEGAIVLFAQQPFTTKLISSNLEMWKYNWIWVKEKRYKFSELALSADKDNRRHLCLWSWFYVTNNKRLSHDVQSANARRI